MRDGAQIGYIVYLSGRGNALTFGQLDMIARHSPVYKRLINMNLDLLGAMFDLAERIPHTPPGAGNRPQEER